MMKDIEKKSVRCFPTLQRHSCPASRCHGAGVPSFHHQLVNIVPNPVVYNGLSMTFNDTLSLSIIILYDISFQFFGHQLENTGKSGKPTFPVKSSYVDPQDHNNLITRMSVDSIPILVA